MVGRNEALDAFREETTRPSGPPSDDASGAQRPAPQVGPYRILGELGRGGMANVYLAERTGPRGFRKWFALKRPHPALGRDLLRLFYREARLAALVSHVNVVPIVELGTSSGTPWLVMEYVRGPNMRHVLGTMGNTGEKLPVTVACVIAADAARGLRAIHEARTPDGEPCGILHRDISPSNLIVDPHGVTRVLDFGIACLASELECASGKTAYMAPEMEDGACDARSDVFSLGAVLWEIFAGMPAFDRGSPRERTPLPRLRSLDRRVPHEVDEVVARMIDANPERRPALADAVRVFAHAARSTLHEDVADALANGGLALDEAAVWASMTGPTRVFEQVPPEVSGVRTIVSELELEPKEAEA